MGFYSKNTKQLTPKIVNDIHKRGGTLLQTSRGGHDTNKIVDNIQDRGINQVDFPSPLCAWQVLIVFDNIQNFILVSGVHNRRRWYTKRSTCNLQGD